MSGFLGKAVELAARRAPLCRKSCRGPLVTRALLTAAEGVSPKWKDSGREVSIQVPVYAGVRREDIKLEAHPTRLKLTVSGKVLVEGDLAGRIDPITSVFAIEEDGASGRIVEVLFDKADAMPWTQCFEERKVDPKVTSRVFFDVSIDGQDAQRVELGLWGNVAPKCAENFRALCTGEKGVGKAGVALHFKGSKFHRVIPNFMIQGGDFTKGDGTGGESIYGATFDDEEFLAKHSRPGLLSMANRGPNTNGSQFFVTTVPCPHLDGKHVVFGEVLSGMDTIKVVESKGSRSGKPEVDIVIQDCGELA